MKSKKTLNHPITECNVDGHGKYPSWMSWRSRKTRNRRNCVFFVVAKTNILTKVVFCTE